MTIYLQWYQRPLLHLNTEHSLLHSCSWIAKQLNKFQKYNKKECNKDGDNNNYNNNNSAYRNRNKDATGV